MNFKFFRLLALAGCALPALAPMAAQASPPAPATAAESRSINDWLMRMHEASRKRSYIGTFVVSSGGAMSSAKIWHVCEGDQQMERVETLTGAPRSIFRHNDQVVTFMPDHKVVRSEKRESLGMFPQLLQSADGRIADYYKVKQEGVDRVVAALKAAPPKGLTWRYEPMPKEHHGTIYDPSAKAGLPWLFPPR